MILLDLIRNMTILLTLCMLYTFVFKTWDRRTIAGRVIVGIVFGAASVIGMLTPITLAPGIILDGRSILLCCAGLFGGMLSAAIAVIVSIAYRISIGGTGVFIGCGGILTSAALGVGYRHFRHQNTTDIKNSHLFVFGLIVHIAMLGWTIALPTEIRWRVFTSALPVILVYPICTTIVGWLLSNSDAWLDSENKLIKSEAKYRILATNTLDVVWVTDLEFNVTFVNDAVYNLLGYTPNEIIGMPPFGFIVPKYIKVIQKTGEKLLAKFKNGEIIQKTVVVQQIKKDGTVATVEMRSNLFLDANGEIAGFQGRAVDITESLKQEEQLAQMRKIESIGMLAGGVAHDFNNMLMGIMGYVELCRDNLEPDNPGNEWLDEILKATNRSADLTRQLLSFARKEVIVPVVLDLNDTISGMLKMLRRLISENVDMVWQPGVDVWKVKLDPGQVNQILANLCVNARDAIDGSGTVTIETKNVTIDGDFCASHIEASIGDYIMLLVQDNGSGMDQPTLKHIFEPFYTTKDVGKGTGLGLATIHGIVKQNNGFITVDSNQGAGTTFKIYLPRFTGIDGKNQGEETSVAIVGGDETILLVEDEKSIRITTKILLETFGYTVLMAESPEIALELIGKHDSKVHLLVTDIVMPGINGRELAEKLVADYPKLKVLYMSGYTADMIANNGVLDDDINFLEKPFTRDVLALKVREVLDA